MFIKLFNNIEFSDIEINNNNFNVFSNNNNENFNVLKQDDEIAKNN